MDLEIMTTAQVAEFWPCSPKKVSQTLRARGVEPAGWCDAVNGGTARQWPAAAVRAAKEAMVAGPGRGNRTRGVERRGGRRTGDAGADSA
jgi:hypothetical protein